MSGNVAIVTVGGSGMRVAAPRLAGHGNREMADTIASLVLNDAGYTTGQNARADGGSTRSV